MAAVKVLVLWGLCVSSVFSSRSSVPAVIWTNNLMHKFPATLAGHSTSGDVFADYVHKSFADKKQNLVVFLQDKLNMEDLSQHADGDTFKNLKNLVGSQVSAHLSGIASPADALAKLKQEFAGKVHEVTPSTKVSDLPMSDEGHDMLVVHLPPTKNGQVENTLKHSDSIIGSVMAKLQNAGKKYTAVYTAKESSQLPDETLYMGRHLLSAEGSNETTFLNVSGCTFFYATEITLNINDNTMYTLPPMINRAYTHGSCGNDTGSMVLTYPAEMLVEQEGLKLESFELEMLFEMTARKWHTTNVTLSFTAKNGSMEVNETDVKLNGDFLFAPTGHCYHCGIDMTFDLTTNSTSTSTVTLTGLQMQVGEIKNNKFGRSNDCIGFFTLPIWSGLIVGLLLVSILSFGVIMLLMMNSIDRFDDPKGKTITVNMTD